MSRSCRHSDASKERSSRQSRAGKESHRSGLYVSSPRNPAPVLPDEAEDDGAYWQQPSRKPVTLPTLKFLERKKIGDEVI
jgi:hypothetical protein